MDYSILKYPRTPHLEGSRLQKGDEDLSQVPFSHILGKYIVIEEKIDGANTAVSFDGDGRLLLQSRGHYLHGGGRERQYNLFKSWASLHEKAFYEVLSDRFVMYGEWMYAKHTVFYDALPDYFMEFDIYDRERGVFLSTSERRKMTERLPMVHSVPVLGEGSFRKKENVLSFIGRSNYITDNHIEALRASAVKLGLDPDEQCRGVDPSGIMEGIYVKMEENGTVVGRFKYVRASFLQSRLENANDWHHRVILPNKLKGEYK